jgi:hypothetical protein
MNTTTATVTLANNKTFTLTDTGLHIIIKGDTKEGNTKGKYLNEGDAFNRIANYLAVEHKTTYTIVKH